MFLPACAQFVLALVLVFLLLLVFLLEPLLAVVFVCAQIVFEFVLLFT